MATPVVTLANLGSTIDVGVLEANKINAKLTSVVLSGVSTGQIANNNGAGGNSHRLVVAPTATSLFDMTASVIMTSGLLIAQLLYEVRVDGVLVNTVGYGALALLNSRQQLTTRYITTLTAGSHNIDFIMTQGASMNAVDIGYLLFKR